LGYLSKRTTFNVKIGHFIFSTQLLRATASFGKFHRQTSNFRIVYAPQM
jgi:hypothetical protein